MATGMGSSPNDDKPPKRGEPKNLPVIELSRLSINETPKPSLRPPPILEPGMRLSLWRYKVELYLDQIPANKRGPHILSFLDDRILESMLSVGIDASSPVEDIWHELDALFPEYPDRVRARAQFNRRSQRIDETIDAYVADLRALAIRAFPSLTTGERELRVYERFTEGILSDDARRRFITDPPTDLKEAIRIAGAYAAADETAPRPYHKNECAVITHQNLNYKSQRPNDYYQRQISDRTPWSRNALMAGNRWTQRPTHIDSWKPNRGSKNLFNQSRGHVLCSRCSAEAHSPGPNRREQVRSDTQWGATRNGRITNITDEVDEPETTNQVEQETGDN